ncbi:drs2 neo1 protein [Coemansia sp. RSA 2049]|nr:drs2 neo1 protein [Coemansia sp. RSA 2049]
MSDSQFSAISEVSSFADALGHVEVPDSFESPSREEEEWARARALEALHQFSTEGLRTLVYAHKEIDSAVYEAWHQRYVAATTALANRQQQVEALCEEIEGDLLLSGVSAIEDRLQNGVPETIFKLRRAGIRVWMLTGDKVETAINIAKSCRLIDTDVVETTSVDVNTTTTTTTAAGDNKNGEKEKEKEKMLLLVMQSITDHDELDKIISNALEAARNMAANSSIDDRFEKRSKREKLRRGMKKFGNMLDPRRLRHRHRRTSSSGSGSSGNTSGNDQTKDANSTHVERPVIAGVDLQRPATAIEWASDVAEAPIAEAARESSLESASSETTRGVSKKSSENSNASNASSGSSSAPGGSLAVVIDGETLAALEQHEGSGLLDKFLSLGTLCDAVICSRVSPSQKALIVHNMRVRCEGGGSKKSSDDGSSSSSDGSTKPSAGYSAVLSRVLGAGRRCAEAAVQLFRHDSDKFMVTLAIGDGGNDIAMIQEAHVGIGIAGQEGLQASRSADFSIGQFRFLQKLLLVHGRWSYVRVSMFIMATFYKCMAFYVMQLIFQFYTGFSGTSLFESWTLSMYNTLFSILPVLVVGIFEQDLQPATLMAYPELYRDMGPRNHLFTVPIFIRRVVVIGIVHSVIAAYFPFASNMTLTRDGVSNDQYLWSISLYGIMVMIVTLKIAYVDVRRWVYFSHLSVVLSLAMWFLWNGVLCRVYPASPGEGFYVLGSFTMLLGKGPYWFQWIIFVAIALCLNVLVMLVYTMRDPVEHRITTWVAFERRNEHARHRAQRTAWLRRRGLASAWELLCLKHLWAGTMLPSRAATETTLALLKPDVLANPAFVDAIVRDITANRCRVTILGRKRLAWTRTQACAFYQEHRARFFYDRLVGYMTSGPFEALALRGPDAVAWWRREMGSTRPAQMRISNPECLRARYGLTDTRNSFHGSDSVESARRELAFVFGNHSFR